jgi:hypothetical protein
MFTASLHISDFVQTQNEAKILTNPLAILGQKSFDRFGNTFPVQKLKLLTLFVTKGQRVKQSNKTSCQKLLPLTVSEGLG